MVQTAAKLVLEPIFEADFEPSAHDNRPGRSGIDAVKAVHRLLCQGFTDAAAPTAGNDGKAPDRCYTLFTSGSENPWAR